MCQLAHTASHIIDQLNNVAREPRAVVGNFFQHLSDRFTDERDRHNGNFTHVESLNLMNSRSEAPILTVGSGKDGK